MNYAFNKPGRSGGGEGRQVGVGHLQVVYWESIMVVVFCKKLLQL